MRKSAVALSALLSLLACTPALAATIPESSIATDTTWTPADSPYIVTSSISILHTTTLTILPGTIIKVAAGESPFQVQGSLVIGAPSGAPVIITSITDDSVGGDTNGDASATVPSSGDWHSIILYPGSHTTIEHTTIRYGGKTDRDAQGRIIAEYPLVKNDGGTLTANNLTLTEGDNSALDQSGGTTIITNAKLTNFTDGIVMHGGSLEFGDNTFTSISDYAVRIYNTTNFVNHGGNTGGNGIYMATQISGNQTWGKDTLPYVADGTYVLSGSTLTIAPGVVVKVLRDTNAIHVVGTLIIGASAPSEEVYITSMKDDSVGGDTNGDESATMPSSGDWCGIVQNPGSRATMEHATIRYGGATLNSYGWHTNCPLVKNDGGILNLDHVTISHNGAYGIQQLAGATTITNSEISHTAQYGIHVSDGTLSVNHSSIYDNLAYGIFNGSVNVIDATNNWWGAFGGPTTYAGIISMGNLVSSRVDYAPWLMAAPGATTPRDPCEGISDCNSNVLFLPGLEASRLYWTDPNCLFLNCENQLWLANSDADAEKLYLNPNGSSIRSDVYTSIKRGAIDEAAIPVAGTNIYKTLLGNLSKWKNDDHIIVDYAVTPYDWRLSVDDVLDKGAKEGDKVFYGSTRGTYIIDELLRMASSSRTKKVTIIAHSNGGLVAKQLMLRLRALGKEDLVDKLILVAVPQVGTPKAVGGLLHGTDLGISGILDEEHARTMGENMPSAYALLPSQKYFETVSPNSVTNKLVTFTDSPLYEPERAQYGFLVSNIAELRGYLLGSDGRAKPADADLDSPNVLKSGLLDQASSTHALLDDWYPASTTEVVQIAGWGEMTISGVVYYTEQKRDCVTVQDPFTFSGSRQECGPYYEIKKYKPNFTIEGDGTVVVPSALWMSTTTPHVERYWVDLKEYNRGPTIDRDHKNITEVSTLLDFIKNKLTNSTSLLPAYITNSTTTLSGIPDIKYIYTLHSPLSLDLYDRLGNHTGISTSTGYVEENIPGSHYGTFGEVKYIIADSDAAQLIQLHGYATGTFSLDIDQMQGDSILASTTFASVPVSASTVATLVIPEGGNLSSVGPLMVDIDGNGKNDIVLVPQYGTTVYPDFTPPEAVFSFNSATQDLAIIGRDVEGPTNTTMSTTSVTVTDKAGNTLTILFIKFKEKSTKLKVVYDTFIYNGFATTTPSVTLEYEWELRNNGTLKSLTQDVRIKGMRRVTADYALGKNETRIVDRIKEDGERGMLKVTKIGLVPLKFYTQRGMIGVQY